jgi:hypothetical protein
VSFYSGAMAGFECTHGIYCEAISSHCASFIEG